MNRSLAVLALLVPGVVMAQMPAPSLTGVRTAVNDGPGDQTDPHVSDALVAYTSEADGRSEIRYHDLGTGTDQAIPNDGAIDFLSDVAGTTVVFTRVGAAGSAVYAFDVATGGPAREVAPEPGSSRRAAAIGGGTVAWMDYGYTGSVASPEIAVTALDGGPVTRLSDDASSDRSPAVSRDGNVVTWTKCTAGTSGCDVWVARRQSGSWTAAALAAPGEEASPDTNGEVVVYSSLRAVDGGGQDRDLYWRPVEGGPEERLALAGPDDNPSISGRLVAFERRDSASAPSNTDIAVFDLRTRTLYRLTDTPQSEALNDISVSADGLVRVVWSVPGVNGLDVYAFSFRLEEPRPCAPSTCEDPGERPLLASLALTRGTGEPEQESLQFSAAEGAGLLCVENGADGCKRATSGWLWLNGEGAVTPSDFKSSVALVEREVTLEAENVLTARLAGAPGSAYRVRVYGAPPACNTAPAVASVSALGVREVASDRLVRVQGLQQAPQALVDPSPGEPRTVGCSSAGPGVGLVTLGLLALWLHSQRRSLRAKVRLPARGPHRP